MDEALGTKDVKRIRNLLKAYITADPSDTNDTIKLALLDIRDSGITVFEQPDDVMIQNDRSRWTEEYFVDLQVRLRNNFSEERYMHMLEVGEHVYSNVDGKQNHYHQVERKPWNKVTAIIGLAIILLCLFILFIIEY